MEPLPCPRAFSYIRFSTSEQLKGDSLRRQTSGAERYALTHGLELDTKFTFKDLGVSAYRGNNLTHGKLGEFLTALEHKDIPSGSYLIIESLDRLSRNVPLKVIMLLQRICEYGITVVTLDDGREYTEESINRDATSLMVALMVAIRANEESHKKGMRLSAAWENKRKQASDKPLTSICPAWLKLREDRSSFIIDTDRASIIKGIYQDTLQGIGQHSIAKKLNTDGVKVFGRGKMWHRSYISKLLSNESVIGTYIPHKTEVTREGKKLRTPLDPVPGYFPSIIDPDVFERVSFMRPVKHIGTGAGTRSTKRVTFTLAGLAKCPACQSTMTRVYKGARGGRPYLICTKAKAGAGCRYKQVNLDYVQEAFFDRVKYLEFDLPSVDKALTDKWETNLHHLDGLGVQIDHLVETIQEYGSSRALSGKLVKLEADQLAAQEELSELSGRIGDSLTNRVKDTVSDLVQQCDVRPQNVPQINTTLHQLFETVEVDYISGMLYFNWKHADHASGIMYALPEEMLNS